MAIQTMVEALGVTGVSPGGVRARALAFTIPLLGVGTLPALVALWIYSLFPIVRNTSPRTACSGWSSGGSGRAA